MQTSNESTTSKALTLLFSALAVVALLGIASIVPDALQAAIR